MSSHRQNENVAVGQNEGVIFGVAISKWERSPAADRLVRLLATALDGEVRPGISAVAEHLPQISDKPGEFWELHIDVVTLQTTFLAIPKAA